MHYPIKHPSRRYIHYLLSQRKTKVGEIVGHLHGLEYPVPTDHKELKVFLARLRSEVKRMAFPPRYNPHERAGMNAATRTFLKKWKIYDYWMGGSTIDAIIELAVDPAIRRYVEVLLLGHLDRVDIASHTQRYFNLDHKQMNVGVVRMYEHYFWDRSVLRKADWNHVIRHWMGGFHDDYLTAIHSSKDQAGIALTLTAAGDPKSLSSVEMYSVARNGLFKMFLEHANSGKIAMSRTQGAVLALQGVTHAEEQLDKFRGGSAELLDELDRISTVYDSRSNATMDQLMAGDDAAFTLPENEPNAKQKH